MENLENLKIVGKPSVLRTSFLYSENIAGALINLMKPQVNNLFSAKKEVFAFSEFFRDAKEFF